MNSIKKVGGYFNRIFINVKDKINKTTKTNSEYYENNKVINEDSKSEFDKNVDDFIENINNK